jgi:hypothetical protein
LWVEKLAVIFGCVTNSDTPWWGKTLQEQYRVEQQPSITIINHCNHHHQLRCQRPILDIITAG